MSHRGRPTSPALVATLDRKIIQAGITLSAAGLTPGTGGADNLVFTAETADGRKLIVKTPRRDHSRYDTATWTARTLADHGLPAPQVIWHDPSISIETRCPGAPLTGGESHPGTHRRAPDPITVQATTNAGALLRQVHSIPVNGYGRLNATGVGRHSSLRAALRATAAPAPPVEQTRQPPSDAAEVLRSEALRSAADRLTDGGSWLLVGDCAARHIFRDTGCARISGLIDLESARGGQPHADIAGFTLREHPQLAHALVQGYFPDGPTADDLWALTVHRARIAAFLLHFHRSREEHATARRYAAALATDLAAITSDSPTELPRHRPGGKP